MADIINIQCDCCGEYIPVNSKKCPFCGEDVSQSSDGIVTSDDSKEIVSEVNSAEKKSVESGFEKSAEGILKNKNNRVLYVLIVIVAFLLAIVIGFCVLNKFNPEITLFSDIDNAGEHSSVELPQIIKADSKTINQAKDLFEHEEYDKAAEIFQQEIDKSSDPVAYYYMGEIYSKRNYTKLAIRMYKQADLVRNNFFEPKKRLAKIYWHKDEDDLAMKYAEDAYKINTNDVELLELLFSMYRYKDDEAKAISICKNIVKVDSKHSNANYYLASYYYDVDNYRDAIPYFENLLNVEYSTPLSYRLAICYARIEYYTKAIEVLDKIIANDPYETYYATNLKANIRDSREEYLRVHKPKTSNTQRSTDSSKDKKSLNDLVDGALF